MRSPLCPILLFFAVLSGAAPAAVLNIDFAAGAVPVSQTGPAAAADPSGAAAYWNSVARDGVKDKVESIPLLDSEGDTTSITLSLGINGIYDSAGMGDQEIGGGSYAGLMADYAYLDAGGPGLVATMSGTVSGLSAGGHYDFYFYGQGDKFTGNVYRGQKTLFTVDGISKQTAWDGVSGGDGELEEGVEYVKFHVQADGSGNVHFSWANVVAGLGGNVLVDSDGYSTRYAAFNGMQIVHSPELVPEPASAFLGALGMLALLRRRR